MTYIFGNRDSLSTPAPQFKLDADNTNFLFTHIKSGILYNAVSRDLIQRKCTKGFEGVSQLILQCVFFDSTKKDQVALADSHSVVELTPAAVDAMNQIAHQNMYHQPRYRGGKF